MRDVRGNRARGRLIGGATGGNEQLTAGLVLAIVLIPDFAAWPAHGAASGRSR
jgi:hypothetical protein